MADQFDLQTARSDVASAQQEIQRQRRISEEARSNIDKAEKQFTSQRALRQQLPGLQGRNIRQLQAGRVSQSRQQLSNRDQQINQFEGEVNQVDSQIKEIEDLKADFDNAQRAFLEGGNAVFTLENRRQREFYQQFQAGRRDAIEQNIQNVEAELGQSLTPEVRSQLRDTLARDLGNISNERLNARINDIISRPTIFKSEIPTIQTPVIQRMSFTPISLPTELQRSTSIISTVPEVGKLEATRERLRNIASEISIKNDRGESVSAIERTKQTLAKATNTFLLDPVISLKDPKALAAGLIFAARNPKDTLTTTGTEIGRSIKVSDPGQLAGSTLGIVAGFGAEALAAKTAQKVVQVGLKRPRFTTEFSGVETGVDEAGRTVTRFVGKTTQQGVISNRQFLSAADVVTEQFPTGNNVFGFRSGARGVVRETYPDIITGRTLSSPPKRFGDVSTGVIEEAPIVLRINDLSSREFERGIRFRGASRSILESSDVFARTRSADSVFAGQGAQVTDDLLFVASRSSPARRSGDKVILSRSGKGQNTGIIRTEREVPGFQQFFEDAGSTKQIRTRVDPKIQALQDQQAKQAIEKALTANLAQEQTRNALLGASASTSAKSITAKPETLSPILENSQVASTPTSQSARSLFEGTGQYERTQETFSPLSLSSASQMQAQSKITVTPVLDSQRENQKELTAAANVLGLKEETSNKNTNLFGVATDTATRTRQTNLLAQSGRQRSGVRTRQNTKTTTKKINLINTPSTSSESELRESALKKLAFNVVTFVNKKRKIIGKALPFGRANRLGTKVVGGTIRGSYELEPAGFTSKKDVKFRLDKMRFRPGKRNPNRIVEKERFRLDSSKEVSEIKAAKRSKSKRRMRFFR